MDWRHGVIALLVVASAVGLALVDPIPQDLRYHAFSDSRRLFGIPNFFDVISNVPFLIAGLGGLRVTLREPKGASAAGWTVLFAGVTLVSAGSAYYHLAPSNATLVWDRLPMTIGFMGLFSALLAEFLNPRLGKLALAPAILIGAASVVYWYLTDDLRFYAWVQFMPLAVVLAVVFLFRSRYSQQWLLLVALVLYALAKVTEALDAGIFDATGERISGHTIKHLLAAAGCYCLYRMIALRRLRS